ncbi:DEAD/DEAH box helicase family protein [Sphingobacterium sp. T2]|uniref:DEAD/DEAH box helicase family protein n=1 Tax=Sphingobacterium sp. T2 TaxID=1590596 RepID=UPI000A6F6674|nr:DEAD/DEAH box helicase family protein [Sphingobacterium sp. T2]
MNRPLASELVDKLFAHPDIRTVADRKSFEEKYALPVAPTAQDIQLYGLAAPERLLQIVKEFILFEGGVVKKVARFQQFFAINKIMKRIKPIRNGKRKGGVVWHTQGSGKSLTMAMLARKIKQEILNPQIIIVTDRTDLDRQITETLRKVEIDVLNAGSGKQLISLLQGNGDFVVTTIINKFDAAVKNLAHTQADSPNIFCVDR